MTSESSEERDFGSTASKMVSSISNDSEKWFPPMEILKL